MKKPEGWLTPKVLRAGTEAHYRDAGYYDHVYKRRKEDIAFYADFGAKNGGPVLEIGVGTGRVAAETAKRGVSIVGVDRMPEMIAKAKERVAKLPVDVRARVTLKRADALRFRLKRKFALVTAPFNVAMHFYERRDIEAFFATARAHMTRSSRFVFDVLMPDHRALVRDPDKYFACKPVTNPVDGKRYTYGEMFHYDAVKQVQLVSMIFQDQSNASNWKMTPLAQRQFYPAELEALLHYNGLTIEARYGDFDRRKLDEDSDSQIIVAKLSSGARYRAS